MELNNERPFARGIKPTANPNPQTEIHILFIYLLTVCLLQKALSLM